MGYQSWTQVKNNKQTLKGPFKTASFCVSMLMQFTKAFHKNLSMLVGSLVH